MNALKIKGKIFVKVCLLIFTLIISIHPQVSDISFDHIFLEDGLSQSIVKCILQDKSGFMYFGTEDGLNIYDGYSFKILRNSPGNPNSLSYNDITCMCEDGSGRLWIGTFNSGVNLFIQSKKKFIRLNYNGDSSNSLSNDNINAIIEDEPGNIWIGTDNGLNCIINASAQDTGFSVQRGIKGNKNQIILANERILSILAGRSGELWVGTDSGLFKVLRDKEGNILTTLHFKHSQNKKESISNNIIRAVFEDSDGDLWIGTDYGLNKISAAEIQKTLPDFQKFFHSDKNRKSISHNEIYAISQDSAGSIWIGTNGGGVNIYEKKIGRFVSYQYDPIVSGSLSTNELRSLFLDRSGIMWIGSYGGGINKVSRKGGQFFHYRHRTNDPNSLNHPIVWSFYQGKDSILWIGTLNGLDRLDRKTLTYKHFIHISGKNSLSNNVVRVITRIDNGKLLLGTNGGGIDEFDPETNIFKNRSHNPANPNSLIHNAIRSIYQDKDGIIWIGTYGRGMDRFDPSTGIFKHFINILHDTNSLSQNYVRVIVDDDKGNLWIGTEGGGLNKFDKKNEKFTRYRARHGNGRALSSDYIFSILIDKPGVFWLGTYGGGLNKFYPETGECKIYTVDKGLSSNSVYSIVKDLDGFLWLSTNNGLSKFNPSEEKFKNYNIKDGLQDNEFNGGAYYRTNSGELLFGGINGFNSFYPRNIKENNFIPPIVLTSFKIFNQEANFPVPLTSIKEIQLSYSDNVFSCEFAALDYFSPEKNKYAYKMEGVDKNWVFVNADKRFAAYTTLSPGTYKFQVKGSNSDGNWNEKGVVLFIKIIPPFWQRAWFIILVAVFIIGVIYILYLRRLKIIRMKIELRTAHDAQLSIMPKTDPVIEKLEVSGTCIPANEVGGDFFDYFVSNDGSNKFGVLIGDVSGKAMKAAITAIMTYGMIISEIRANNSISKILENVNTTLIHKIEKKMFVSACICMIDTERRILSIANAGLSRPIILSGGNAKILQPDGPRLPLGVKDDIHYKLTEYNLEKNDLIILTTDGVDEAQNNNRELFGVERLKNHLLSLNGLNLPVAKIKESIINEVQKFINKDKPCDDMTVLVIRIK